MEAAAARQGLGLAYAPEELVREDLERGTLTRYSHRLAELHLYYPHRNVSPALRMMIDTLRV
ncbi:LysR substrate-binding domain-containing protein [Pectobacterium parvum]|uniref:LysR substrate-binding domain-containing protein n=1 Tax=Pectobacterium parvum TaxID=2778550 RepID=UPI00380B6570